MTTTTTTTRYVCAACGAPLVPAGKRSFVVPAAAGRARIECADGPHRPVRYEEHVAANGMRTRILRDDEGYPTARIVDGFTDGRTLFQQYAGKDEHGTQQWTTILETAQ